jgi:hypothetical protein
MRILSLWMLVMAARSGSKEEGNERLTVIPAKAGIQWKCVVQSTPNQCCVLRTRTKLDSGLRRNDERWAARDDHELSR